MQAQSFNDILQQKKKKEMMKVGGAKSGRGGICVYHISAVIPNLKILGKIYTHKPTAKLQSRYF